MADEKFRHIVRIANVDIPGEKVIKTSLQKIKGIGTTFAEILCIVAGIDRTTKTGNLTDNEIEKLNKTIANPGDSGIPTWMFNRRRDWETGKDSHILTGTLGFTKENDLKRLKKVKTLRGMRHQKGLPVRGQRTRSNFRRNKGKVVGVKKKGAPGKK